MTADSIRIDCTSGMGSTGPPDEAERAAMASAAVGQRLREIHEDRRRQALFRLKISAMADSDLADLLTVLGLDELCLFPAR